MSTTISKIVSIPNSLNSELIDEFYKYMKNNGASERHQNNNLKVMIAFAKFLGKDVSFYNIQKKEQIITFLDTKVKNAEIDPDKKWITTWNHNLHRVKHFLRWLHNYKDKKEEERSEQSEWETPSFARIKEKKTKRVSPYLESELWERDEILFIVKYESYLRNKAALTLFWDLDARNHEITLLKIKHIRLLERYGEGEIPHESKTGTGPILLTCSFPYVRDWINKHPFKNSPDASLICNLYNGSPVRPEVMWTIMKQLRSRIIRMLENGSITDNGERQTLEYLLNTKKWNPYCIRHSSISSDSDFLPEYALKKKVRWSMNSNQGSRYIKRRMGNDLKQKILVQNGIISELQIEKKPSVLNCPRCSLVNAIENKYCSKCSYPLLPSAFDEIKEEENRKLQEIELRYESNMKAMREEMNQQFIQIMSMIQLNPKLADVKPEALIKKRVMEKKKIT
jgi:integrase/recombinase XerD